MMATLVGPTGKREKHPLVDTLPLCGGSSPTSGPIGLVPLESDPRAKYALYIPYAGGVLPPGLALRWWWCATRRRGCLQGWCRR